MIGKPTGVVHTAAAICSLRRRVGVPLFTCILVLFHGPEDTVSSPEADQGPDCRDFGLGDEKRVGSLSKVESM